ncbi:MAG TPA: glycosyltransferase family 1 protein, partial [Pyrinomonadaceae bacterium]|nr:glycosyltransferase family 1 protein [Pyrinomonadaceae bacterium]
INLIPLAAAAHFSPAAPAEVERVRRHYGITGAYILAVGSIQPRKNLARLARAYSALRRARPHDKLPKLVLVGKKAWLYDETLRAIAECGLTQDVVLTGYVPEADLPALYTGALCFAYPSYFEGFGLPPLEAMRCGTPILAGDRTSLPEVVGPAGLLVDPFDEQALAAGLARLIDDSDLRADLRVKGIAHAARSDWRAAALRTLEVYQRATRRQG